MEKQRNVLIEFVEKEIKRLQEKKLLNVNDEELQCVIDLSISSYCIALSNLY